jgi:hypothetical protein
LYLQPFFYSGVKMSVNVPSGDSDSCKVWYRACCKFNRGLLSANAALPALNRI